MDVISATGWKQIAFRSVHLLLKIPGCLGEGMM